MHISTSEIIRISHFVMLNVNVSKEERKKPPFLLSQPCCQDMHVAWHSCKSGKGVTSVFKPLFWPANFRLLLVALFCMSELTLLLLFLIYIHAHVKACVYVLALRQLRWQWLPGELKLMTVIRSKLRAMQGQLIQAMWAELVVRSARHGWSWRDGGLRCNHRQIPPFFSTHSRCPRKERQWGPGTDMHPPFRPLGRPSPMQADNLLAALR